MVLRSSQPVMAPVPIGCSVVVSGHPCRGSFTTDPAIAACVDGSIYVVGKDNSSALWSGRYIPGTGFQNFVFFGGAVTGKPSVSCGSDNAIYILARQFQLELDSTRIRKHVDGMVQWRSRDEYRFRRSRR